MVSAARRVYTELLEKCMHEMLTFRFIGECFDDILSIAQSKRDQAQEESKMLSKKCTVRFLY